MNNKELERKMSVVTNSMFINVSELARFLGSSRESARFVVDDLEYLIIGKTGKAKAYFIPDVAKRILEHRGK
ncbi:hypothetical protein M2140_000391 [Clostridiales Family XIII bacterium PM5-7]